MFKLVSTILVFVTVQIAIYKYNEGRKEKIIAEKTKILMFKNY